VFEGFVYRFRLTARTATLLMRHGFITAEFFELAGKARTRSRRGGAP
jgi:hypothetical protein